MSFLDCESTPLLSCVCPRCCYGMTRSRFEFKMYFNVISSLAFFFSLPSLLREKHDGRSCLTTTAKTPRETPHFGIYKTLRQGRTGANGAEEPAAEEESPVSGWRLPRSEASQVLQQTLPSPTTCPAAVTSARAVVAQTGLSYPPQPYRGSRAVLTTRPPAVTLCLSVKS